MSEIPDVVSGEPIEADWGNDVRSRTIQRYVDASDPDLPTLPVSGDPAWLEAPAEFRIHDGTDWVPVIVNGRFVAADGALTGPAFSFVDAPNTGMYRGGAGTPLGFVVGGLDRFYFDNNNQSWRFFNTTDVRHPFGEVSRPGINFEGDLSTGIFRESSGVLAASAGGNKRMSWESGQTAFWGWPIRYGSSGSPSAPAFSFVDDSDTGMYRSAVNELSLSTQGIQQFRISNPNQTSAPISFVVGSTGAQANMYLSGSLAAFGVALSTSSIEFKDDIATLELDEARRIVAGLDPITFVSMHENDDNAEMMGFGLEPTRDLDERLAPLDATTPDLRAVVAAAVRVLQDIMERTNDES